MTHTFTVSAEIALPPSDQNVSSVIDFDGTSTAYLTNKTTGGIVNDSDGNPVLVFFDKSTGQAYCRIATYNPNDDGGDAASIESQGGLGNFKGQPEHHGFFVPISSTFIPTAGNKALNVEGIGVLAAYTALVADSHNALTQVATEGADAQAVV